MKAIVFLRCSARLQCSREWTIKESIQKIPHHYIYFDFAIFNATFSWQRFPVMHFVWQNKLVVTTKEWIRLFLGIPIYGRIRTCCSTYSQQGQLNRRLVWHEKYFLMYSNKVTLYTSKTFIILCFIWRIIQRRRSKKETHTQRNLYKNEILYFFI